MAYSLSPLTGCCWQQIADDRAVLLGDLDRDKNQLFWESVSRTILACPENKLSERPWIRTLQRRQWVHFHQIIPGLYLGNCKAWRQVKETGNLKFLKIFTVRITSVISLWKEGEENPDHIQRIYIPVKDKKSQFREFLRQTSQAGVRNRADHVNLFFEQTFQWIDQAVQSGEKILIHCRGGVSRSATLVIAYLMKRCRLPYETVLNYVRAQRPAIEPNRGFRAGLRRYSLLLEQRGFFAPV